MSPRWVAVVQAAVILTVGLTTPLGAVPRHRPGGGALAPEPAETREPALADMPAATLPAATQASEGDIQAVVKALELTRAVQDKLNKRITPRKDELSIDDLLDDLQDKSGVTLKVDWEILRTDDLKGDKKVTLTYTDALSTIDALKQIFGDTMGWTIHQGKVVVSNAEDVKHDQYHVSCAYDVHDLVVPTAGEREEGTTSEEVEATMEEVFRKIISPETWREEGNGGTGELKVLRGILYVKAPDPVQLAVYDALRAFRAPLKAAATAPAATAPADANPASARARTKLAADITLTVKDKPIDQALAAWSKKVGVPVMLDPKSLGGASASKDLRATVKVELGAPAGKVLDALLASLSGDQNLTWLLEDGVVLVANAEELNNPRHFRLRVYPIGDLIKTLNNDLPPDVDVRAEIVMLIVNSIAPGSWQDSGGGAALATPYAESLVIRQTEDAHTQIAAFLAELRRPPAPAPAATAPAPVVATKAELRARERLKAEVAFSCKDEPAAQAFDKLAEALKLDLVIHWPALETAGLQRDTTITIATQSPLTGDQLLTLLLSKLGDKTIVYRLDGGLVHITTRNALMQVRVFDVRDYLGPDTGDEPRRERYKTLTTVLQERVDKDTWTGKGGSGEVSEVNGHLVIKQSEENLRAIETLLRSLHVLSDDPPPREPPATMGPRPYRSRSGRGLGWR